MLDWAKKIFRKVFKRKKSFSLILDSSTSRRLLFFNRMKTMIDHIDGDIVECGVGKTRSFQMLAFLFEDEKRKLWGFDSFEGFPEPSEEDKSFRNPQKGQWKLMKKDAVKEILLHARVGKDFVDRVEVVKGFFEDTLEKNKVGRIALLHLDVDLYNSYKICLEKLYSKVVAGGVIIFDEYRDECNWPGATKAIDEFLKDKKHEIKKDALFGKHYLIKNG